MKEYLYRIPHESCVHYLLTENTESFYPAWTHKIQWDKFIGDKFTEEQRHWLRLCICDHNYPQLGSFVKKLFEDGIVITIE